MSIFPPPRWASPPPEGTKCSNCGERQATLWRDDSGMINHGFEKPWCEPCSVRRDIEEIREMAERLPELEAREIELQGDPMDELKACPVCGNVVLNTCHHDGEDVRSQSMTRRAAADLKRRNG